VEEREREEFFADMLLPPFFMATGLLSVLAVAFLIHPAFPSLGLYVAVIPPGIASVVTLAVRSLWRRRISARYCAG
jgi:membrane protein CcdC involved in cytochrome C biogenesis